MLGRGKSARRLRGFWVSLGAMLLAAYFTHHAVYGRYGLERNRALKARHQALLGEVAALQQRQRILARDLALLGGEPHPDIVEEYARRTLGFAYPKMRIVRNGP